MAQSDWTAFPGALLESLVDRGVSSGFTPPSGGGSWVYGWHTLQPDEGAVGLYYNRANFVPMAKGGSIRAALKRQAETGATPFLFLALQGSDVGNQGYLLGLAHDEEPARLVIVKGVPSSGLEINKAVVQSTAAYQGDEWIHVRLDVILQASGDVVLKVYENDLDAQDVASPVWVEVPGMESFTDDQLGVNSGSQPFEGGYAGFGYYTSEVGRQGYIDHVEVKRQL